MKKRENRQSGKKLAASWICLAGTMFLTEFTAGLVAASNGGYGTFDMKRYNAEIYLEVMKKTTDFGIYWKYYICDFLFLEALLQLQLGLIKRFCRKERKLTGKILNIMAAARALLDSMENGILLYLIYGYPIADSFLADLCSLLTRIKFYLMGGWMFSFLILWVCRMVPVILYRKQE